MPNNLFLLKERWLLSYLEVFVIMLGGPLWGTFLVGQRRVDTIWYDRYRGVQGV